MSRYILTKAGSLDQGLEASTLRAVCFTHVCALPMPGTADPEHPASVPHSLAGWPPHLVLHPLPFRWFFPQSDRRYLCALCLLLSECPWQLLGGEVQGKVSLTLFCLVAPPCLVTAPSPNVLGGRESCLVYQGPGLLLDQVSAKCSKVCFALNKSEPTHCHGK